MSCTKEDYNTSLFLTGVIEIVANVNLLSQLSSSAVTRLYAVNRFEHDIYKAVIKSSCRWSVTEQSG